MPATAVDSAGTQYLVRSVNLAGPFEARLYTLDASGRECTSAAVSDESLRSSAQTVSALWVSEHGEVYIRVSNSIARLTQ